MKHYYTNYDDLAKAWVKGEVDGEVYTAKRRMYATMDAIYSYGPHFCIARRWKPVGSNVSYFLLTERRHSQTTETHKREVYSALYQHDPIMLPQVDNLHEYGLVNGTREDLAKVVYETECRRLDNYLSKYLKMLRPYDHGGVRHRIILSLEQLRRFGFKDLPEHLNNKAEQAHYHYEQRRERNAVLDSTAHARRRLLAA